MLSVVTLNAILSSVANKPIILSVIMVNVIMLSVLTLNVIMPSFANKPFTLSVVMLNVIIPSVTNKPFMPNAYK